jgi:hypothetical protein
LTEEEKRALDIQHDVGVEIYDIKKRNVVFSFASNYQQQNFAWKKLHKDIRRVIEKIREASGI